MRCFSANGKTGLKGRDWLDFEWYVRQGHPLNLNHFAERARQSGDLTADTLSRDDFQKLLSERIATLNIKSARENVARFVPDPKALEIWSREYFQQLTSMIRFVDG